LKQEDKLDDFDMAKSIKTSTYRKNTHRHEVKVHFRILLLDPAANRSCKRILAQSTSDGWCVMVSEPTGMSL
jgi:hypothetical protein